MSTSGTSLPSSRFLSLRQTLLLGAGLGILLPALVLTYVQLVTKYTEDVNLRVRAPMVQYADVLARGMAVAIWNVDRSVGNELMESVMRNPDVARITVLDDNKEVFLRRQAASADGELIFEEREVVYNGARVGKLVVHMSVERVRRDFWAGQMQLAVAIAAQVLFSFILIWVLLERRMFKPLLNLRGAAERLARGELADPIEPGRKDEIGMLAGSMETMRTDIASLIAERDQKNRALEHELLERQRAEEAVRSSEVKFAATFEASPVALSVSRKTDTIRILDVNAAWARQFRRDREDVVGSNGHLLQLWEDTTQRDQMLDHLFRQGKVDRFVGRLINGNGGTLLCEISGRIVTVRNEILLILAWDDITERDAHEREILQLNSTLEQLVQERTRELSATLEQLTTSQAELVRSEKLSALGSLVAGIAHELNTPIGNSLTVASTLQDHVRDFKGEMAGGLKRSQLDAFVESTGQGASILMNGLRQAADLVSSFKQVAVDQTSLNRRRFNLRETVGEVLMTLGPSLRKTTHIVENNVPEEIAMESYPGPLGQIITNLVNNAVLHAFEGQEKGVVAIHARILPGQKIELTVRDNGRGIPEANLGRVFDPFFTTKLGKGGSGLGLNIVYNLVSSSLGGKVEVSSVVKQGTCFTFVLPQMAPGIAGGLDDGQGPA